ncbi:hypothetical protein MMC07_003511 [Pseudocyphellaria aurata]|nr:hypothetical protein [Pseudocyphellaria aurata]
MRLTLAGVVWLVPLFVALVGADISVDGIFPDPMEGSSEDEQAFALAAGSSPGAPCAPDNIQFQGKLRAREVSCEHPSNGGSTKNPEPKNTNGNGNGKRPARIPKLLPYQPSFQYLPPSKPINILCLPKDGEIHLICHEGPSSEIHHDGAWIENALECMSVLPFTLSIGETIESNHYIRLI